MNDQQPFYAILAHMRDFYGVVMENDKFENIAIHAWDIINNKNTRTYRYDCSVGDDGFIQLPCNADILESVTTPYPDFQSSDNVAGRNGSDHTNYVAESYIESHKANHQFLYDGGKYLDYERVDNTLYFKSWRGGVTIIYKGVLVDDDGLPTVNFKEIEAIAKYCVFIDLQKTAFVTKDKSSFELAQVMNQQWSKACAAARSPIYMNQNELDGLLNVQTSWDRKRFGLSYKPLKQ